MIPAAAAGHSLLKSDPRFQPLKAQPIEITLVAGRLVGPVIFPRKEAKTDWPVFARPIRFKTSNSD